MFLSHNFFLRSVGLLFLGAMICVPNAFAVGDTYYPDAEKGVDSSNEGCFGIKGCVSTGIMSAVELFQDIVFSDPKFPLEVKVHLPRLLHACKVPANRSLVWQELRNTDLSFVDMTELRRLERIANACHLPID